VAKAQPEIVDNPLKGINGLVCIACNGG